MTETRDTTVLPKSAGNLSQERLGIAAVAIAAAKMNLIWRETSTADVGIDGHLEFVNATGQATGRLVGVQVKSGSSFFKTGDETTWHFYPEQKHRDYWERYPLPVLLILHSPEDELSYWVDVRQVLRSRQQSSHRYIAVPKENVLQRAVPEQLFWTAGVSEDSFIDDLTHVLKSLIEKQSANGSFPVSWFELFTHGLTSSCRSLYFGMDLAVKVAEYNLERDEAPSGIGVGEQEHEFLFEYVRFLLAQNLADIDYADYLIDWDAELQPKFVARLTPRGRQLVRVISEEEDRLVANGALEPGEGLRVAQEGFFEMVVLSYFRRMPRITRFQELARADFKAKPGGIFDSTE